MLVEAGYEVVTLTGPYGVLAKFDFEKPDILLFNLDMPNFDTDVLLDTVIHAPQTRNMAVIALATGDAQAVEEYCKSQNVHGFFMKDQGLDSLVAYLFQLSLDSLHDPALLKHQRVFLLHKYWLFNVLPIASSQASIKAYVGRSPRSLLQTLHIFFSP